VIRLQAVGITHVLDLRAPREWEQAVHGKQALHEIERRGLQRHVLTVPDMSAPTPAMLNAVCKYLDGVLRGEPKAGSARAQVYVGVTVENGINCTLSGSSGKFSPVW